MIRKEFIERSLVGIEEKSNEKESIMSEKRYKNPNFCMLEFDLKLSLRI